MELRKDIEQMIVEHLEVKQEMLEKIVEYALQHLDIEETECIFKDEIEYSTLAQSLLILGKLKFEGKTLEIVRVAPPVMFELMLDGSELAEMPNLEEQLNHMACECTLSTIGKQLADGSGLRMCFAMDKICLVGKNERYPKLVWMSRYEILPKK